MATNSVSRNRARYTNAVYAKHTTNHSPTAITALSSHCNRTRRSVIPCNHEICKVIYSPRIPKRMGRTQPPDVIGWQASARAARPMALSTISAALHAAGPAKSMSIWRTHIQATTAAVERKTATIYRPTRAAGGGALGSTNDINRVWPQNAVILFATGGNPRSKILIAKNDGFRLFHEDLVR